MNIFIVDFYFFGRIWIFLLRFWQSMFQNIFIVLLQISSLNNFIDFIYYNSKITYLIQFLQTSFRDLIVELYYRYLGHKSTNLFSSLFYFCLIFFLLIVTINLFSTLFYIKIVHRDYYSPTSCTIFKYLNHTLHWHLSRLFLFSWQIKIHWTKNIQFIMSSNVLFQRRTHWIEDAMTTKFPIKFRI